jgi:hypothetical protein
VLSSRSARWAWLTAGAVCVAAVAVYGELSGQALLAVAATGVVVLAVGLVRRAGEAADPVGRRALPWSAWLLAALLWELITLVDARLATLSDLMDPVLASPVVRAAATAVWLAAGARLLALPAQREVPR